MTFNGWIHSNGSIWACSENAWYEDLITTTNKFYMDYKFMHCGFGGVYIDDATGTDMNVEFDSRSKSDANDFRTASDAAFDNRLKTDAYGVDSLRVPLPAGTEPLEIIQPREASDGTVEQNAKFAWKADWYIEVDLGAIAAGTGQGPGNSQGRGRGLSDGNICDDGITHTRTGTLKTPNTPQCEGIFFFGSDMWYEARELRYADVVEIDVAELQTWAASGPGDPTSIVYVTVDTVGAEDVAGDGIFPVIRLFNGASLTSPITLSSNHPMYVQGDFNTGVWQPVALVGDALTILSNNWNDAQHQTTTVRRNDWPATSTELNAAILAGHSPTPCDHEDCGTQPYGGGLENFPRFLENWNGDTMTYVGSLVSLFYNTQGDGSWKFRPFGNVGQYYYPPTRNWSFDTGFENPDNLPPGTPVVGNVIHTAFRPIR